MSQSLPQEFSQQNRHKEKSVEQRAAAVPMLQVEDGRKTPDVFGIRGAVAQQAAHYAHGGKQRHGQVLAVEHGRHRDQHAGEQPGDITSQNAGKQATLQAQIAGEVTAGSHPRRHSGAEYEREP